MIDGELESDSADQLNAHLEVCETCRRRTATYRQLDSLIFRDAVPKPGESLPKVSAFSKQHPIESHGLTRTMMRWVPLATAAAILVGLMVTTFPDNRSTVTAEQIARPLAELEIINADHRESQERMRKMMELDLRALKIELSQLDEGDGEAIAAQKQQLEQHVNQLIERVSQFGL
jgi:anti-sigma factor RsiW